MDPRFWGKYPCQHDMTRVRVWNPHRFRPTIYLHNHTDNQQYTRLAHGRKSCHGTIFHYSLASKELTEDCHEVDHALGFLQR